MGWERSPHIGQVVAYHCRDAFHGYRRQAGYPSESVQAQWGRPPDGGVSRRPDREQRPTKVVCRVGLKLNNVAGVPEDVEDDVEDPESRGVCGYLDRLAAAGDVGQPRLEAGLGELFAELVRRDRGGADPDPGLRR